MKSLDDKYFKAKDILKLVEDSRFVAKVKLTRPKEIERHLIKLDQEYIETVISIIDFLLCSIFVQELHLKLFITSGFIMIFTNNENRSNS
ncbi:DNA/RNA-binding protein KIN17-like [Vespula maculifrons]|uniref:DNA/RNA-binding protein KIN17-like n=1 Tax=Vespula maculifrons TaxID=7453 RepID=A0ABD2CRA3_VESMC